MVEVQVIVHHHAIGREMSFGVSACGTAIEPTHLMHGRHGSNHIARALLESSAHVQALVDLGVERRVFRITSRRHGHKASTGRRVGRSEQSHINPSRHEPLGEDGNDPLPGSVKPRRNAPGYGREHPHAQPIGHLASERRHARRSRA